jgi:hypothetical protein
MKPCRDAVRLPRERDRSGSNLDVLHAGVAFHVAGTSPRRGAGPEALTASATEHDLEWLRASIADGRLKEPKSGHRASSAHLFDAEIDHTPVWNTQRERATRVAAPQDHARPVRAELGTGRRHGQAILGRHDVRAAHRRSPDDHHKRNRPANHRAHERHPQFANRIPTVPQVGGAGRADDPCFTGRGTTAALGTFDVRGSRAYQAVEVVAASVALRPSR